MRNPYDASNGGIKDMITTVVISRPKKGNPYQATRPVIKQFDNAGDQTKGRNHSPYRAIRS